MPQWIADALQNSHPGSEIGYSHDISKSFSTDDGNSDNSDMRLVLSNASLGGDDKPGEYGLSLPNSAQNLWVFHGKGDSTEGHKAMGTVHMIPKRDEKYTNLLKQRLSKADISVQHRTLHDEASHDTLRGAVHLFQRPSEADVKPQSYPTAGSPDSQASSSRVSKRMKSLDELPQNERRQASNVGATKSLDDVLMSVLVNDDKGWPLQALSKAVKDAGVSAPMAQLKTKLLEICVYQRRGDDTHPKYYLKGEYK
jgi:hypothetical protein